MLVSAITSAWHMVGIQAVLVESESLQAMVITELRLKRERRCRVVYIYWAFSIAPALCLVIYMHIVWYSGICCSVTQSCLTLCNPMDCSTPVFSVLHHLPELAQAHVHWVSDAIQPSCSLLSLDFLPSIFPSIRVFSNESTLHIR